MSIVFQSLKHQVNDKCPSCYSTDKKGEKGNLALNFCGKRPYLKCNLCKYTCSLVKKKRGRQKRISRGKRATFKNNYKKEVNALFKRENKLLESNYFDKF